MASQSDSRPRPPLDQSFSKVGTFTKQPSGAIVPDPPKTSKEEGLVTQS